MGLDLSGSKCGKVAGTYESSGSTKRGEFLD